MPRDDDRVIGGTGLRVEPAHERADVGYWIGAPFWGHGFATEAAGEIVRFGLQDLCLHKITSSHFADNPASGHVLRKLGFVSAGVRREHYLHWGTFKTLEVYELLTDAS